MTGTYGQCQAEGMNYNGKRGKFLYFWLMWEFDSRIAENLRRHGDVFQAERQPRHRLDLSRYLTSLGAGMLGTCLTLAFDEDTLISEAACNAKTGNKRICYQHQALQCSLVSGCVPTINTETCRSLAYNPLFLCL